MFALFACVDNELVAGEKPFEEGDFSLETGDGVDTEITTTPAELCNGIDDDGDGEVDENFPDEDGNGRVDCLDATCPASEPPPAGEVERLDSCSGAASVSDPWDADILWQNANPDPANPSWNDSNTTPLVAQLDDDDGDGDVDGDDNLDVVLVVTTNVDQLHGTLVALDAVSGDRKWTLSDVAALNGTALADIDGDGQIEIVATREGGPVIAVGADGSLEWSSEKATSTFSEDPITVLDWDGDGDVEIYIDGSLLDGATGDVEDSLPVDLRFSLPAFADIDLDGEYEIIGQGQVYDHDGDLRWSDPRSGYASWPVVVQADDDDEAEIAFVDYGVAIHDTDGDLIGEVSASSTLMPGAPAVADFDGDGAQEIVWVLASTMRMVELDGTVVWETVVTDSTSFAGCSAADLDGDGDHEVLFGGEYEFVIVDGRSGDHLYSNGGHSSQTIAEYPVPVDVDHDGHTEILLVSSFSGAWGAVTALTHGGDGWEPAGQSWGVHDYQWDNLADDGSVPSTPPTPWLGRGLLRAGPPNPSPAADLAVEIAEICVADCDYGPVELTVVVSNPGDAEMPAGGRVEVYAGDGESPRWIAGQELPAVPALSSLEGIRFALAPADVPTTSWIVEVQAPDGATDCVAADDRASSYEGTCP